MAGIGDITAVLGTSNAGPAAPTGTVNLTVASGLSTVIRDFGAYDHIYLPSLHAVLFAQGTTFQYHALDGAIYLNGPRAPVAALTAASTATAATRVLTFAGANSAAARPSTGETIQIGKPGQTGAGYVTFKTTLDPTLTLDQVLIGADVDATITNLTAFINGTGAQGDKWFGGRFGWVAGLWASANDIEVSASTAFAAGSATITFRSKTPGTVGNSYISVDNTTTGSFPGATFTGGAVGTGTDPGVGQFIYAYAAKRSADNALTGISPTTTLRQDTNCNVSLSALADSPSRDGADFLEWYRTQTGDNVYYSGAAIASGGAGTATDSSSDSTISSFGHNLTDAGDQARNYRPATAGYPPWCRCVATFRGSALAAGAIISASNTTISGSVSLSGTTFTATAGQLTVRMIGRTLRFTSTTDDYVIIDVNEAANTAVINRAAVAAKTGVACTITDARDPCEIFWTPPLLYNNWPVGKSIKGVRTNDPKGITALSSMTDGVAAFTPTGLWRVYGDPGSAFQVLPVGEGYGAYSPRSVVDAGGTLYWIGPSSAFAWSGSGTPTDLGQVEDQERVRGIMETLASINPDAVDGIVGVFNPNDLYVKWYIPVDGSPYNNRCLALNTTTGAFTLDTCPYAVTAAGVMVGADGDYHTVIGDAYGLVYEAEKGLSDGAYSMECVAAVSSYATATLTITCSGAAFTTTGDGLKGIPLLMVTNTGLFYEGKIASNTGTTLTLAWPMGADPASTSYVVVGAIHRHIATNRFDDGFLDGNRTVVSCRVLYSPASASGSARMYCAAAVNNGSPAVYSLRSTSTPDYADLTNADGEHLFTLRKGKGRRAKIEWHDFIPGYSNTITALVPVIPVKEGVMR